MSKPREYWWSYVKGMVRNYPQLEEMSQSQEMARPMPQVKQRELAAVRHAIEKTQAQSSGKERLELIRLMYWPGRYTMDGAALQVHCASTTARRYHGAFIHQVAQAYGLCD